MDPNVLCVVSTTRNYRRYVVHALDISDVGANFAGPIHTFPPPILSLPISTESREGYPYDMSFGNIGSKLYMLGGYTYPRPSSSSSEEEDEVPSLSVFVFDMASNSVSEGPSLNFHKGTNPIVIPFGNKLFVLPQSLDATTGIIEVFDDSESAWVPLPLPPEIFEMTGGRFSYNPFEIKAYGKKGSEILLSLEMCRMMKFGDLAYNVDTQEWRLPCSERAPSELTMRAPIILGSLACSSHSDINAKFIFYTEKLSSWATLDFFSPIPLAGYRLVKHGEQNLVAFSWSPDPKNEERAGSYFRVDMMAVSRRQKRKKRFKKVVNPVAAKIYEHNNDKPRQKPAKVHYCYLPHQGNWQEGCMSRHSMLRFTGHRGIRRFAMARVDKTHLKKKRKTQVEKTRRVKKKEKSAAMDSMLFVVTSSPESYNLYGLDTSIATTDFGFVGNVLPAPILELPKSVYPQDMTFQFLGSTLYMFGGKKPATRPSRSATSSTDVYSIDLTSFDDVDLSKVTQCPPLPSPPKPHPISIVCDDKLFVISSSLNPSSSSSSTTSSSSPIHFLDPQESDSWVSLDLPSWVVEELSPVSAQFVLQSSDGDPYKIKAYGTRGHEIILDLQMFTSPTLLKSLVLNTRTHSWNIVYIDPSDSHLPFRLPFIGRNLCADSTWFAPQTEGGRLYWIQCSETTNTFYFDLPSPVYCDVTKLAEFGPTMVLALSYTTDPEILEDYPECSGFLRVDFVQVCDVHCNAAWMPVKKCCTVRAANYLECSAPTKLHEVVYFYSRPPPS